MTYELTNEGFKAKVGSFEIEMEYEEKEKL